MKTITHPTKEQVRQYLAQRRSERALPFPSIREIRSRIGWHAGTPDTSA